MLTITIPLTNQSSEFARGQARLPKWMLGIALAVTLGLAASGYARWAVGFALGAALGILNYLWLHQAIGVLFSGGPVRLPRFLIAKFVVRYPLAVAAVYLFYQTRWLPFTAILAGLFVPAGGVMVEAVLQLREGLSNHS